MKDELNFLGIGSAFNPALGNTCAWFTHSNQLFLLDCGETVFERIVKFPLESYDEIYVIVTHLHNDHAGSLAALVTYCYYIFGKKIHVVHPEQAVNTLLGLMGALDTEYFYHKQLPASSSVKCRPCSVRHAGTMPCYGYIIDAPFGCFYYSGDAQNIPEEVLIDFKSGKIQRMYQDTSMEEKGHHAALSYIEELFDEKDRKRVYCMHLESEHARQAILEKGFQIPEVKKHPQ